MSAPHFTPVSPTTLEHSLLQVGFERVDELPVVDVILHRDFVLADFRGILKARLTRRGACPAERISVVYFPGEDLLSLCQRERKLLIDFPGRQVLPALWHMGISILGH